MWFEHGLKPGRDLRYRLSVIPAGDIRDEFDWIHFLIGLSVEHKSSNRSGSAAFLAGFSTLLLVDIEDADKMYPLISPFFGGVFGYGDPGDIRVLLTTRMNVSIFPFLGLQAGFSVGMDLPAGEVITFRPEAGINFGLLYLWGSSKGEWAIPVWGGLGLAMIF